MATAGHFQFCLNTDRYEATVAFYRDALAFAVHAEWDNDGERGTVFALGGGFLEILSLPGPISSGPRRGTPFTPPAGAWLLVESHDLDGLYRRAVERGLEIVEGVRQHPWGHRDFGLRDPNGLLLYFFAPL